MFYACMAGKSNGLVMGAGVKLRAMRAENITRSKESYLAPLEHLRTGVARNFRGKTPSQTIAALEGEAHLPGSSYIKQAGTEINKYHSPLSALL